MLRHFLLLTAFLLAPAFPAQATIGTVTGNLLANLGNTAALPKDKNETSHTQSLISPAKITITGTGDAAQDQQSRENADRLTQRDPATAHQALQNRLGRK